MTKKLERLQLNVPPQHSPQPQKWLAPKFQEQSAFRESSLAALGRFIPCLRSIDTTEPQGLRIKTH